MKELIGKAAVLIEALPYIQKFRNSIMVVKFGGSAMEDPELVRSTMRDVVLLEAIGIRPIVVHGGGKAISRAMEKSGLKAEFRNGMRVTDEKTVKIVEDVLNNEVNSEICKMLEAQGCKAKSLPGNDVLCCKKLESFNEHGETVDIGYVGKISLVKAKLIKKAIAEGYTPVVSPIAMGMSDNHPYNTNADVAAAAVASALKARRLVFLCDVPGLMRDPKDRNTLISHLKVDEVQALKDAKIIGGGMMPKVDSGVEAIRSGVRRVHFVDGYMPHSILLEIFTDEGIGTEIVTSES